jgi:methyl-accepting chemotaxis protein
MKRPSIRVALTACLLGMFAMTGGLAYMSTSSLTKIDSHNDELVDDLFPSALLMKEINVNMGDIRIGLRNHVLAITDEEQAAAEGQIKDAKQAFDVNMALYEKDLKEGEEKQKFEALAQAYTGYVKAADKMLAFSVKGQDEEAKQVINGEMKTFSDRADEQLDALVAFNTDGAKEAGAENQLTLEYTIDSVYIIVSLALLVGIGVIAFALTQISRPINRITDVMRRLAGGDLGADVPYAGRSDEIGAMAGAVDVFKQSAIANRKLEAEAEQGRKQAELDRIATQEKAEAEATERLRVATSGLASGLQRLATGDLSFQLNEAFAPDFEGLRHNFNQSIQQLGVVPQQVVLG